MFKGVFWETSYNRRNIKKKYEKTIRNNLTLRMLDYSRIEKHFDLEKEVKVVVVVHLKIKYRW